MMVLWWLGNALLILVILPVVLLLLQRLLRPTLDLARSVEDTRAGTDRIVVGLDQTSGLVRTRDAVRQVSSGLGDYARTVYRIL